VNEQRIKPWMVALALAVVGIAGVVGVFVAGRTLHSSDRADLRAWRTAAAPSLAAITDVIAETRTLGARVFAGEERDVTAKVTVLRKRVERARAALEDIKTPAISDTVASAYLNALVEALEAVTAIHQWSFATTDAARAKERKEVTAALARATRLNSAADDALHDLELRFELAA
jgi:hypothetical protein